jgi:outer membrane protein assembly factor BamD
MLSEFRHYRRRAAPLALALFAAVAACSQGFNLAKFKGDDAALFAATMREYQAGHWDNAVAGFERLTLELPARDTLLPVAHYYLGLSHGKRHEHLLAAQAYTRLTESYPEHALADDALYGAARSYHRLWRKPQLDAQYGQTAVATYRLYLAMYPNGDQRAAAEQKVAELEQRFATKEYLNGMFYRRRKYFDSAVIYFRGVVTNYPNTPRARDAWLRLAEVYREIHYAADATDACQEARTRWPDDSEVRRICPASAVPATPATTADTTRRPAAPPAGSPTPVPSSPARDGEAARPPPADAARP